MVSRRASPMGIVYLVGAGPGASGLMTLSGALKLGKADVVVYDRLVNRALLELAPASARKIYAGKLPGEEKSQARINKLLAQEATRGKTVARLKGGDPYLFGRGAEEALYLAQRQIPFEVVPGITAALGAASFAGIPLTHRDLSSIVAFATGEEAAKKKDSTIDWSALARMPTIVFYMGARRLGEISKTLIAHGKSPGTPVALIENATLPSQRLLTGNLRNIPDEAARAGVKAPAVVVVGRVVELAPFLNWFRKRPLLGVRVAVTRAATQMERLREALEELGAEVICFPTIRIERLKDQAPLRRALGRLGKFDWVVFTSANAVESVFSTLESLGKDSRAFGNSKICSIGPSTSSAVHRQGLRVDLEAEPHTSQAIAACLARSARLRGARILLPRSDAASRGLPRELRRLGARCAEVTAYRTIERARATAGELEALGRANVVLFTSPSTVRGFVKSVGKRRLARLRPRISYVSIGPVTTAEARRLGLPVAAEAPQHTMQGALDAITASVSSVLR